MKQLVAKMFQAVAGRYGQLLIDYRSILVVVTQLIVPKKLSDSQRRLLADYAETEDLIVDAGSSSWWEKLKDAVTGG